MYYSAIEFVWLPESLRKPLFKVFIHNPTECEEPRFIWDTEVPRKWKAIIKKKKDKKIEL